MKKVLFLFFAFIFSLSSEGQSIDLQPFASSFDRPLGIQNAGDERLFIVEQGGKIKIVQPDGSISQTPFLDISDRISSGGERGLLGLAFHPNYANNGYFFLNYTNTSGDTHISRFSVNPDNQNIADPISELLILSYSQPAANHNGGELLFGPDGYLYISSGDGGESGDPNNRAQNTNEYLGKILRIDIDNPEGPKNYSIPPDNPFVNVPDTKQEIWAYGLRNPWRFTIDEPDGKIWIADVGQASIEEINAQPINAGGLNYGWRCYEGNLPFNSNGCPPDEDLTFPIATYDHSNGRCSITGGRAYRGNAHPEMEGFYFFADYCKGTIGTVSPDNTLSFFGDFSGNWVSFGEDSNKELYIADITGGRICKIVNPSAGIDDFSNPGITLFPNPASGEVEVKNTRGIQSIDIYDASQRKIVRHTTSKSQTQIEMDVSPLRSGVYFIKVVSDDGVSGTKRLIKK